MSTDRMQVSNIGSIGTLEFGPLDDTLEQETEASAASMLESDSDDYLKKTVTTQASQQSALLDASTATNIRDVTLSAPDQLALTQQLLQNYLANPSNRLATIEEQIARQLMLIADGCFFNGAVGGISRSDFEAALRATLNNLMVASGRKEPYVEDIDQTAPVDITLHHAPTSQDELDESSENVL